jgi:transposase-like protein
MTDAEHAERTALMSVFPEADILGCFFHVIKASKEKLSGNKDKDEIMKDITLLHMSLSQQKSDHKWSHSSNCWIVNSNSFAVYFQRQWVEGCF